MRAREWPSRPSVIEGLLRSAPVHQRGFPAGVLMVAGLARFGGNLGRSVITEPIVNPPVQRAVAGEAALRGDDPFPQLMALRAVLDSLEIAVKARERPGRDRLGEAGNGQDFLDSRKTAPIIARGVYRRPACCFRSIVGHNQGGVPTAGVRSRRAHDRRSVKATRAVGTGKMKKTHTNFHTTVVHAGACRESFGSVVPPIYQTSTFAFANTQVGADRFAGKADGYIYTRLSNPTIGALEDCVAALEEGAGAIATSSGMGALTTICLALLESDRHVVSTASLYGTSRTLMEKHLGRFGVTSSFVDSSDPEQVRGAIRKNTRMVYVETPSNPMMQVTDIQAVARVAHEHGALLVVDSTFASPYLQKPLVLDADVVLHSVTKFINGHADVVGGIIVARDEAVCRQLREMMIIAGCNMDPHQAFLVHRGLKTLALRMERAQESALKIARWLEGRDEVAWVRYVGLPSHPQYETARRQMKGPGAMISFELKGGLEAGKRLLNHVHLVVLAVSLGGVESLIEHPASMTHAGLGREERLAAGITDGLVRYSVGIEDADDLIEDLRQALEA